jgi:predicted oxidoreductase
LHRIDAAVPAEEQLGTLKELQSQGKIKHIGLSEVSVEQIRHAQKLVSIVSVQNRYSVVDRAAEDDEDGREEMNGHRGYYADGWEIVTLHQPLTPFDDAEWELYDLTKDISESNDLSAQPLRLVFILQDSNQGRHDWRAPSSASRPGGRTTRFSKNHSRC